MNSGETIDDDLIIGGNQVRVDGTVNGMLIAYLVGDLILAGGAPNLTGRRFWAMALGVLIYSLVRAIPFLGWLIGVIATIVGVGAMWLYYRSRRAQPPVPAPAAPVAAAF